MAKSVTETLQSVVSNEQSAKAILELNSFGLIRLVMASIVLYHHSVVLTGYQSMSQFGRLGDFDLGTLGVLGFFAVSGFLLIGSAQRLSPRQFLTRRFFRLFPAFWACLIVCAFIIVPIANEISVSESSFDFTGNDSSFSFAWKNSVLVIFQYSIGTVFAENLFPLAINGSLWTLAPEFICYVGLLVATLLSRKNLKIQFALIVIALAVSSILWQLSFNSNEQIRSEILNPTSEVVVAFCTGCLLAIIVEFMPFRLAVTPTLVGLGIWAYLGADGPISIIALCVLIVFLGAGLTGSRLTTIGKDTDISYGVYLYHFPIIQTILVASTHTWSTFEAGILLTSLSFFISVIFAIVSWKFIEKPSISFARSFARR